MVVRRDQSERVGTRLSWTNPATYEEILLYRDGCTFAALGGTSTSYVDLHVTQASHVYAVRGRIGASRSSRSTCTFTAENFPPVPVVTIPELNWRCEDHGCSARVCSGASVTLEGGASYDLGRGQKIALWEWDLDGDGAYDDHTGPSLPTSWEQPGTYRIGLKVTDDFKTNPLSRALTVSVNVSTCAFIRGDVNGDRQFDIGDPISTLAYLFGGAGEPSCLKSADANDDGTVDIADAISLLSYLFARGEPPRAPHPACGTDPTEDSLSCEAFPPCE